MKKQEKIKFNKLKENQKELCLKTIEQEKKMDKKSREKGSEIIRNTQQDQTRLFFVTETETENKKLHETLDQADDYTHKRILETVKISICIVKNAYYETDLKLWNYEDRADTFEIIRQIQ